MHFERKPNNGRRDDGPDRFDCTHKAIRKIFLNFEFQKQQNQVAIEQVAAKWQTNKWRPVNGVQNRTSAKRRLTAHHRKQSNVRHAFENFSKVLNILLVAETSN